MDSTTGSTHRPGDPLRIVLEVDDHDGMVEALRAIDEAGVPVRTKALTTADASDRTARIDMGLLTRKQRLTVELALEEGYYDRPRDIDMSALSDRLDVSKSAVSQRLRSAETKLIENLFGQD